MYQSLIRELTFVFTLFTVQLCWRLQSVPLLNLRYISPSWRISVRRALFVHYHYFLARCKKRTLRSNKFLKNLLVPAGVSIFVFSKSLQWIRCNLLLEKLERKFKSLKMKSIVAKRFLCLSILLGAIGASVGSDCNEDSQCELNGLYWVSYLCIEGVN